MPYEPEDQEAYERNPAHAIARAVAAERERCTKIAETVGVLDVPPADEYERGYHDAAMLIANNVRQEK